MPVNIPLSDLGRTSEIVQNLEAIKGRDVSRAAMHLANTITTIFILKDVDLLDSESADSLAMQTLLAAAALGISKRDLRTLGAAIIKDCVEGQQ